MIWYNAEANLIAVSEKLYHGSGSSSFQFHFDDYLSINFSSLQQLRAFGWMKVGAL